MARRFSFEFNGNPNIIQVKQDPMFQPLWVFRDESVPFVPPHDETRVLQTSRQRAVSAEEQQNELVQLWHGDAGNGFFPQISD